MHLCCRLCRVKNIILFQVIWQDPRFNRRFYRDGDTLRCRVEVGNTAVLIASGSHLDINKISGEYHLYLRGVNTGSDNHVAVRHCLDEDIAEEELQIFRSALEKFPQVFDWENLPTGFNSVAADAEPDLEVGLEGIKDSESLIHMPIKTY